MLSQLTLSADATVTLMGEFVNAPRKWIRVSQSGHLGQVATPEGCRGACGCVHGLA